MLSHLISVGQGAPTIHGSRTPSGYLDKLLKKTDDDICEHLSAVLGMFGVDDDPSSWQGIPPVMTSNLVAAAFTAEPAVAFPCRLH